MRAGSQFNVPTVFEQDNETLLKVLENGGYSAKLRHCGRVHRVNIASMAEQVDGQTIVARYCNTKDQIANGFTKIIPPAEWPHMLTQLGFEATNSEVALPATVLVKRAEEYAASLPGRLHPQHLVQLLTLLPTQVPS